MPLSCDCYGGCWGAHARERNWLFYAFDLHRGVGMKKGLASFCGRWAGENGIPYGTYVIDRDGVYFEDERWARIALEGLSNGV